MIPTGAPREELNRAGLMRLVIAIVLVIMAAESASRGRLLTAGANAVFAVLAGMLAWATLPGRRLPPRPVVLGILAAGITLWLVSFVVPS